MEATMTRDEALAGEIADLNERLREAERTVLDYQTYFNKKLEYENYLKSRTSAPFWQPSQSPPSIMGDLMPRFWLEDGKESVARLRVRLQELVL